MEPREGLDKRGEAIREMFAGVAPRYDLLNHLLSGALDVVWRKRAAAALHPSPGGRFLDLCCGTGDQALAVRQRGGQVVATDFCLPMLALARRKFQPANGRRPQPVAADALLLPFPSRSFAGATVSFGLRNVADLDRALRELARVLAPGSPLVILEFTLPRRRLLRGLYLFYFLRILPWIGRLVSPRGSAYTYLPGSVLEFPQREEFVSHLAAAGFVDAAWQDLSLGVLCLYFARREE